MSKSADPGNNICHHQHGTVLVPPYLINSHGKPVLILLSSPPLDFPESRGVLRESALGGDCCHADLPGVHPDGVGPTLGACLAQQRQHQQHLTAWPDSAGE